MSDNMPSMAQPNRGTPPSADTLAVRALAGEEQAFEELHRRLGGGLRRFLQRRVGGRAELLDELTQTTWVEVWRALHEGRYDPGRARISTFVYAVGHKTFLRYLRAVQRGGGVAQLADYDGHAALWTSERPETQLEACELLDAVRDCLHSSGTLHSLTDEERAVVLGVANRETERALASRLGIAASTVNARKKTAYEKLRGCLARKGFAREIVERSLPGGG